MKTNLILWSMALSTALLASPSIAQQHSAHMTQRMIHDRIIELCKIPNIGDNIVGGMGEICEFSPDNWLNWYKLWAWASILALIGAGAIFRSKKKKREIIKASNGEDASQRYSWEVDWKEWDIWDRHNSTAGDIDTDGGLDPMEKNTWDWDDELGPIREDILSETNVLIAYWLYDNAIGILKENISLEKENIELYIKLLEVYYLMQKKESFAQLFQEDITDHFGEQVPANDLAKMKKWGNEIDPDNTLYHPQTAEK